MTYLNLSGQTPTQRMLNQSSQQQEEAERLYAIAKGHVEREEFAKAAPIIENILTLIPDHIGTMELKAILLYTFGDYEAAYYLTQEIKKSLPQHGAVDILAGRILVRWEKNQEAIAALEPALVKHPLAEGFAALSRAHFYLGHKDKAIAAMARAVELAPDKADHLYMYVSFLHRVTREDDPFFQRLLSMSRTALSDTDSAYVHYALFKARQDMNQYDQAFEALNIGAAAKRRAIRHEPGHIERRMTDIRRYFTADFFAAQRIEGNPTEQPVFILGMPRSGTTLLEQILHAHPDVSGIGEETRLSELVNEFSSLADFGGVPYPLRRSRSGAYLPPAAIAREYLHFMNTQGKGARRIVSKSIGHRLWAGLSAVMFPNARFIHITRDPMDMCFSCYSTNFMGPVQGYTYDLAELGAHYKQHAALMAHWNAVLPGRILTVAYEDIVRDTEGQTRRLLDFLGLPWDGRCLEFYRAEKSVSSASVDQVRQPIYDRSIGRWKAYEKHLAPLINALKEEV